MPIKVILQDIHGTQRLKSVIDLEGKLNKLLPIEDTSYPLLQYVDPYGNAVFSPSQMPQVIKELEQLSSRCSDERSRDLLEEVVNLALECQGSRHLYLRFVGD